MFNSGVAQLVERLSVKQDVVGSYPTTGAKFIASLVHWLERSADNREKKDRNLHEAPNLKVIIMKIVGIDGLLGTIYKGCQIIFWKGDEFVFVLHYDEDKNKIVVQRPDIEPEYYHSFRNGNEEFPDLENFCKGWSEMLNDPDIEVEFC